jgi:hypothetical protein
MSTILRNKEYALYSKGSAAQFKLRKLVDKIDENKSEENYWLFVEAANVLPGQRKFDWENKCNIRLGLADLGIFLNGFRTGFKGDKKCEIFHDPGKGSATEGFETKAMAIQPGASYGYQLVFRYNKKADAKGPEKKVNVAVPVSDEQMVILKILLERSVVMLAGFYDGVM